MQDDINASAALSPESVRVFRDRGTLVLTVAGAAGGQRWEDVRVARAFPLSDPNRFIGFRDASDKEIGLLESLDELDAESRRMILEELQRRYFVPVIQRVIRVREEGSMTTWDVETDRGAHTFILQNLRESVFEIEADKRLMLTDVRGLRWEVPDVQRLEPLARAILARGA